MKKAFDKTFATICKSSTKKATLYIENGDGSFSYEKEYGDLKIDSPIIIASITKMFTTACILKLIDQNKLSFDEKIEKFFDHELGNLFVYKNKDYTSLLTIYNLIFQTSGLPDVFDSGNIKKKMLSEDFDISFNETLDYVRTMKPRFSPLTNKKAYYADVNFDILGEILERIYKEPLDAIFNKEIILPLGLKNTFLPTSIDQNIPTFNYKKVEFIRPKSVISSKASGGIVSTTRDLMIFIKAFYKGKLFNIDNYKNNSTYRKLQLLMMPMQYGCGCMYLPLRGYLTAFQNIGNLYGHLGSSGSFAFYLPEIDFFYVGTLNEMSSRRKPVQLLLKLAMNTKKGLAQS